MLPGRDYVNGLPSFLTASCVALHNGQERERERERGAGGSMDSSAPHYDITKDLGTMSSSGDLSSLNPSA